MNQKEILELKTKFDNIISKYKFNQGTKTQELVDYIISKQTHSAKELANQFNIETDEANILLQFFQEGIKFKQEIDKQNSNE